DLTQEVFTRALGALGRFNGQYQFEPWLLRIARNLVIDESRRDLHRPTPTDPVDLIELEDVPVGEDRVWEKMSQHLAGSLVRSALAQLPLRQRTVLVLREIEGMSYSEIAEIVGTNMRGVEATLRRARQHFRLAAAEGESFDTLRSTCKRTLRMVACESSEPEVGRHLDSCKECRMRANEIRSSDKLFGALAPLALTKLSWISKALTSLQTKPVQRKGLLQTLRGTQHLGLVSPLAHIIETTISVAVAGVVSISTVAGQTARVAIAASDAPPAFTAQTFQAIANSSDGDGAHRSARTLAPAPSSQRTIDANRAEPHGSGTFLDSVLAINPIDVASVGNLVSSATSGLQDVLELPGRSTTSVVRLPARVPVSPRLPAPDVASPAPALALPRKKTSKGSA
ncbi:MAG: sigma-70 family RNA polymerase sigma factor, partial [Actinobacteria bacterium]|nr:sigma-70 family RNA polymerase sigma factor [Actinomycetota bacterium]